MNHEPTEWYYYDGRTTQGPVPRSALAALAAQYGPALQVRYHDQPQWYGVAQVIGHVGPNPHRDTAASGKTKAKPSNRRRLIGAGVLMALLLIVGGLVQNHRASAAAERAAKQCRAAEAVVAFVDAVPVEEGVDEVERYLESRTLTQAHGTLRDGPLKAPFSNLSGSLAALEAKMGKVAFYRGNRSGSQQMLPSVLRDQREAEKKVERANKALAQATTDHCP